MDFFPDIKERKYKLAQMEKISENRSLIIEIGISFTAVIIMYVVSGQYDIFEMTVAFVKDHESWEMDELFVTAAFSSLVLLLFTIRRWLVNRRLRRKLARQYAELIKAREEIRQLKGIVPICSSCKQIRDDKGFWQQVEQYVETHSEATFTHSMCPACLAKHYGHEPWFNEMMEE